MMYGPYKLFKLRIVYEILACHENFAESSFLLTHFFNLLLLIGLQFVACFVPIHYLNTCYNHTTHLVQKGPKT